MERSNDGKFPETEWTLIRRLKSADPTMAKRALEELCRQYHYPLYCCIRHQGLAHHDAEDALQDFLAKLLRRSSFAQAEQQKGRLRALLGTALQRFLRNWHRDRSRRPTLPKSERALDIPSDASRFDREKLLDTDTPAILFERKWALELLRHVLKRLGDDYLRRAKSDLFQVFKPTLLRGGSLRGENIAAMAERVRMKEASLRVAYVRFLRDYRGILEDEVRQTVNSAEDVQEEIAYLRSIFEVK